MSNLAERAAEDAYEAENDYYPASDEDQNTYAYQSGNQGFTMRVPVQRDETNIEDPMQPPFSDTDQQLAQDEREAIDRSNILAGKGRRLRHAKPHAASGYNEGPNEDNLPEESIGTRRI
ncbi:hypothetical protein BDW62DRAFT_201274 [Aspergillus aurantiobrunneus]